jgi:hypothetical protein
MTKYELNNEYFEWMHRLVYNEQYSKRLSYRKLLAYLHNVEFIYIIGMDSNRAEDGIDLRYRFGYEHRYENPMIATYLDRRPSSVLEMPVALSMRCKESIMDDPDACDRTGRCLWNMIANLGLGSLNDRAHRRLYS